MKHTLSWGVTLLMSATLAACGGGGGDGPESSGPSSQVQGRWTTAAGSAPAYTAVGLPSSGGAATLWILANDATRLAKLSVADSGAVTGRAYVLGSGEASTISGSWSTSGGNALSLTGLPSGALNASKVDALTTPAVQSDAAGTWTASSGASARIVTWAVSTAGAVSGTSTTGCSYGGTLTAMANASAYTAAVTERCPDGGAAQYNGIATLNSAKNALSMVATSADERAGVALFFSK